jgi:hypothetical protein
MRTQNRNPNRYTATDTDEFLMFLRLISLHGILSLAVVAQVINLRTHKETENIWFEVGSCLISSDSIVTIQSNYQNYLQPVIFLR